jgi:hypothetical protein
MHRHTLNSFDQFASARQTDKAILQLAANAHDPAIRGLIVESLNEQQHEVNACHKSKSGMDFKRKLGEKKKIQAVVEAQRTKKMKNERVLVSEVKEASKEVTKLAPPSSQQSTSLPFKGIRRGVERYSDAHHHSTNGHLLPEAERTAREWTCGLCYGPVSYGYLEHNGSI